MVSFVPSNKGIGGYTFSCNQLVLLLSGVWRASTNTPACLLSILSPKFSPFTPIIPTRDNQIHVNAAVNKISSIRFLQSMWPFCLNFAYSAQQTQIPCVLCGVVGFQMLVCAGCWCHQIDIETNSRQGIYIWQLSRPSFKEFCSSV